MSWSADLSTCLLCSKCTKFLEMFQKPGANPSVDHIFFKVWLFILWQRNTHWTLEWGGRVLRFTPRAVRFQTTEKWLRWWICIAGKLQNPAMIDPICCYAVLTSKNKAHKAAATPNVPKVWVVNLTMWKLKSCDLFGSSLCSCALFQSPSNSRPPSVSLAL